MSWQYKWCIEIKPAPAIIVLTGATGDLAKKKLFTAFEQLHTSGMWPEGSAVIGCGRRNWNDEDFRQYVQDSSGGKYSQMTLDSLFFAAGDVGEEQFAENLSAKISALLSRWQGAVPPALIFHFALAPGQTGTAVENLGRHGLFKESEQIPAVRAIFEKPFGFSGREAETLAAEHSNFLREDQIYRIDHYLGKDTIRNIMVTRFANRIFEPAWNSEHIEKIIISAAEDVDVAARAAYYDKSGCIRDMFQNHLLEMLALTVMDRPDSPGLDSLTAAKTALLQKVQIKKVETAQYCGYTDTPGINADSKTETAACITLSIDTPRWENTEFVLFSGKAMAERSTSIKIIFRSPASSIFPLVKADDFAGNVLAIEIQPEERMSLGIQVKRPGPNLCMGTAEMSFSYPAKDEKMNMDAYARLITEAMLGDRSTFVSLDMIKTGWSIFDPVLDSLQKSKQIPAVYPKGSAPEDIFRELLF